MWRIYALFVFKKAASPVAVNAYALLGIAAVSGLWVSFGNVFANMPRIFDVPALYGFTASAFVHTELAVQILSAAFVVALVMFAQNAFKNIKNIKSAGLTRA